MAKSWEALRGQLRKIDTVIGKVTPPEPDDTFEDIRRDVLAKVDQLGEYVHNKIEGSDDV